MTLNLVCRLLLGSALLLGLAGTAHAQNPVVPGQSPLRRLNPAPAAGPPGQPTAPGLGQPTPGRDPLDSLRTLSGTYKKLETNEKTLVLFDLTAGFAHPLGEFGDSPAGGGAANGGTLTVGAAYLFTPHLGVFGSLGGGVQSVRPEAIDYALGLTAQNTRDIHHDKAGWSHVTLAAGPQFTLPLGRPGGLALDLRPGVGLTYAISPRYGATFTDTGGQQQHQFVSSAGAFAVSWHAGAALRVLLGERLGLRLGADYFYTRPAFNDYSPNTTLIINDSETRRTLSFGQLSLGLVVRFE